MHGVSARHFARLSALLAFSISLLLPSSAQAQSSAVARVPSLPRATSATPGTASFLGNLTGIFTSSQLEGLVRESDCSLTQFTGNYSLGSSTTYTKTGQTSNYERTLHTEAQLTTTPDVFTGGCASSNVGIGSRPALYLGTTSSGVNVFAGIGPSAATMQNALYLVTGTPSTTYTTLIYSFITAGSLTGADLNKDGNPDIVIANNVGTTSAGVSVLLGKADGSYTISASYPTAGAGAVAVDIDDFNGDGILDIAAVSNDQQISILLGKGDGTFQAAQTFAAPALPGYTSASSTPITKIASADLRSIGRRDIVCNNGLVLMGNGDGTFIPITSPAFPYQAATGSQGPNLALGDVNKDGKPDIVFSTGFSVQVYLGDGTGTFTAGSAYASINSVGYVTISDLDGDGNPDIYVGLASSGIFFTDSYQPNGAYALMGKGDGTFVGAQSIPAGGYNGTNVGDVNGDGVPDMIVANAAGGFSVLLGTGKGSFSQSATVAAPATFTLNGYNFTGADKTAATTYAVADVNRDGYADLVFSINNLTAVNPGSGLPIQYPYAVYFVALSKGDGTFATTVPYAFPQVAASSGFDNTLLVPNLQLADVNKDGKADLIFTYNETAGGTGTVPYNQGLAVLAGVGDGTFSTTAQLTSTYSSATAPTSALLPYVTGVADVNNDTKPDLVVVAPSFSVATGTVIPVEVFPGNGDGTFAAPKTLSLSANVYGWPVVADFNKDGKLDFATLAETTAGQAELAIALGNGDGTFATPSVLPLSGGDVVRSGSLAAADFNNDGKLDLSLMDGSAYSGILYGNGDGSFQSISSNGATLPQDLIHLFANPGNYSYAGDLNKDGKPDLIAGNVVLVSLYGTGATTLTGTSTALTASASSIGLGGSVKLTATVTPASGTTAPTGTVTFMDGATSLGTGTLSAGVATFTSTSLIAGTHSITAVYGGDSNYTGSTSSAVSVTVSTAIATTTALTASPTSAAAGASVVLTATVTPASGSAVPGGTVTFNDGTTALGTGTLNASGVATYTTSSLAVGVHSVTAVYASSSSFAGSSSAAVSVTITAAASPGFTLSLAPASSTVMHGSPVSTTLTVGSVGGFSAVVALYCSGAPANSTCSVSPASVTPAGATPGTVTVTLQTSVQSAMQRQAGGNVAWAAMLPLGLFGLVLGGRRRRWAMHLAALAVGVMLLAAGGCGGKSTSSTGGGGTTLYPAAGTYTLTVSGVSGSTTHTATWSVTIQ